jgi:hypothetical protein
MELKEHALEGFVNINSIFFILAESSAVAVAEIFNVH